MHDDKQIERSVRAVTAIRQVVQALWALSRAQLPLAEHAAAAAETYQSWVDDVTSHTLGAPAVRGDESETLDVVFGPERPFSGPFARRMLDAVPPEGALGLVGSRFAEAVDKDPGREARVRFRCKGSVSHDDIHEIALEVAKQALLHGAGQVFVWHATAGDPPFVRVPIVGARTPLAIGPETLSPPAEVFSSLLHEATLGRLAVAAILSLRAEIRARMLAADSARKSADKRLVELRGVWHRTRRESITRELMEVVAGREASGV